MSYVIALETPTGTKLWQKGTKFVTEYPDAREFTSWAEVRSKAEAVRVVREERGEGGFDVEAGQLVIIQDFGLETEQRLAL